jgi:hypothetical protein
MKNLKRFTNDKGAANIMASNKGYDNHLLRLQGIYKDPDGSMARRKNWRQFSEQDKRVISQVKEKKRNMFLIHMIGTPGLTKPRTRPSRPRTKSWSRNSGQLSTARNCMTTTSRALSSKIG